jgi:hypothetical protein
MDAPKRCRFTAILVAAAALSVTSAAAQSAFGEATDPLEGIDLPGLSQYAPSIRDDFEAGNLRSVALSARLTEEEQLLQDGLVWRIFGAEPGSDGKLPLIASAEGGTARFDIPPGDYFLHLAFGRAAVSKKLTIPQNGAVAEQVLTLDAGGVILNARSGDDRRIDAEELRFSIYAEERDESGRRALIVPDVKPGTLVRLNAGTYHVVSTYGAINASVRSDIHIKPGKLTEATIEHRAAELTLKLVSEEGGEAIADTAWSILTETGDPVTESVGAFPTVVLAEGEYIAVARNKDRVYQRDFTVKAGVNKDVEVLLTAKQARASRL